MGGDFRRRVGAVCLQRGYPLADGAPLVVLAFDGGIAPLDGHARGESRPCGMRFNLAQVEGGHILDLPAPVVGSDLDGLDGRKFVPCLGVTRARGQIHFEGLEDDGNAALNVPDRLLDIWRRAVLRTRRGWWRRHRRREDARCEFFARWRA